MVGLPTLPYSAPGRVAIPLRPQGLRAPAARRTSARPTPSDNRAKICHAGPVRAPRPNEPGTDMIVSHRHKFIFIKTKKTAGTSIELALRQICGPEDIISPVREDRDVRF